MHAGFELELLAPKARTRVDLAEALAGAVGGSVEHGLKLLRAKVTPGGALTECCELTGCVRVREPSGAVRFELVDDYSVLEGLGPTGGAAGAPGGWRLITDDPRLGRLLEREARGPRFGLEMLEGAAARLGLELGAPGHGPGCLPDQRLLRDPHGMVFAVMCDYPAERWRVTEVVTAPLRPEARREELERIVGLARHLGFKVPLQGSVHVHFDGARWRSTPMLRRLVLAWSRARERLLQRLRSNPNTAAWRAPFTGPVLKVVAEADDALPFSELAERLLRAGLHKRSELNLLGVVLDRFVRGTVEARIFTGALDAAQLLDDVALFEDFLEGVAEQAERVAGERAARGDTVATF